MSQPKLNSKTESVLLSLFVPVCASNGAELLLSALKWPKRVKCHQAETREVAHYQELTRMIQIPSLAPFFHPRLTGFRDVIQRLEPAAPDRLGPQLNQK